MKSNTCPYCGYSPAVPSWRKSCLGPAVATDCRACGKKVSVSRLSMLIVFPVVVAVVVLTPIVPLLWEKAAIWAALFVIAGFLQWSFVRIVQK
jgi:hypothetical protein